jgi:hypothetical protein
VSEQHREAVNGWVAAITASPITGPAHIHLDDLFNDYARARGSALAAETFDAAVVALGEQLDSIKPILSIPHREIRRLTRRPPDLSRLAPLLHDYEPPSLNLVRRDAFGRVAMLAEGYELPLRLNEQAHAGTTVWFYRTSRLPDADGWSRRISIEHFTKLGYGQRLAKP